MPRRISDRERDLKQNIAWFRQLAEDASETGSFQAAVTSRAKAAALEKDYHRLRDQRLRAPKANDALAVLRFAATMAELEGSWQAAARFRSDEGKMLVEIRQAEAQKAAAEMAGLDEAQLMDIMSGAIDLLPIEIVLKLRERITKRLGPEVPAETPPAEA